MEVPFLFLSKILVLVIQMKPWGGGGGGGQKIKYRKPNPYLNPIIFSIAFYYYYYLKFFLFFYKTFSSTSRRTRAIHGIIYFYNS
jgi:hypothetical protein